LDFFHFSEFFHLFAVFRLESAAGIANFEHDVEFGSFGSESDKKPVLIERHAAVFDGIVDEFVGNEREPVFPRNFDGITFEKEEDEVPNHFRLAVIRLEGKEKVELPRIGNIPIGEIEEVLIFELRDVDLELRVHSEA
jgi:hypothetical protein